MVRNLIEYVKVNKVRYKWVWEVEIVESILKSVVGKIFRWKFRDILKILGNVIVRDEFVRVKL